MKLLNSIDISIPVILVPINEGELIINYLLNQKNTKI
jgi:hypothetical protein